VVLSDREGSIPSLGTIHKRITSDPEPAPTLANADPGAFAPDNSSIIPVSCPGNIFTSSFDRFQNRVGGCGPSQGFSLGVLGVDEMIEAVRRFFYVAEGAAADRSLRDEIKPDFRVVEP
jgi:hypothetical protein